MRRRSTLGMLAALALVAAACSSGPTSTPAGASAPASMAPEASQTAPASMPAESNAAEATSAPTAIDPCQLVTASEASTLAGATYASGTESTSGGSKICTYSSATAVVNVIVAQAPDAGTAQADWAQEQAQAETYLKQGAPAGVTMDFKVGTASVTGADQAAAATASGSFSGVTLSISAIYVLKGATFFSFSELTIGRAAADISTLEAQAVISVGRVP